MVTDRANVLGPVSILVSTELQRKLKAALSPLAPDLAGMLAVLNTQRGVPVLVEEVVQHHPHFLFGAGPLCLVAQPAGEAASFTTTELRPLKLPEQHRFAREALWVHAADWQIADPREALPLREAQKAVTTLLEMWRQASAPDRNRSTQHPGHQATAIPPIATHERYLERLDGLISLSRRLEQDRLLETVGGASFAYLTAEPEPELHRWLLICAPEAPRPRIRDRVRLRDAPTLRGVIVGQTRQGVIVEFSAGQALTVADIPTPGWLELLPSVAQFNIQREAVATLRAGGSSNPHLLDIFVDHRYQPLRKAHKGADSPVDLDPDQLAAWKAAQTIPDALLVLGPPGTGKTHTIAHITSTMAARGQRILITARTHRAVDNALERLSAIPGLRIIRAGQSDRVAPGLRHLLLDAQTHATRATILERVDESLRRMSQALAHLEAAKPVATADDSDAEVATIAARIRSTEVALLAAQTEIDRRYGIPQRLWETELADEIDHLRTTDAALADLAALQADLHARRARPFIGLWWAIAEARVARRLRRDQQRRSRHSQALLDRAQEYFAVRAQHAAALQHPDLAEFAQSLADDRALLAQRTGDQRSWLGDMDAVLAPISSDRPEWDPARGGDIRTYQVWAHDLIPVLRQRLAIMRTWRSAVAEDADTLVPLLIENADVVGATCIGIATTRDLPDEEFDLVIADEAGQIGLVDLLVPLVRARRAILVGDHQQLPPFVADEIQQWLTEHTGVIADDLLRAVGDLLTKSAFELLFPRAEPNHRVLLTQQKRMPRVIADFLATQFYGNQLRSPIETDPPATSPVLAAPLTLVDTSDRPRPARAESVVGGQDASDAHGYRNEIEAALVADLVDAYAGRKLDWVVITPYQAQAERVRELLRQRLPNLSLAELLERVATVDSFQGGERDYVFFSFTRSNANGNVGFLRELRRLNVTMSRSRRQLILVGDFPGLCAANDAGFQRLARALVDYVQQHGERVRSTEVPARIAALREMAR